MNQLQLQLQQLYRDSSKHANYQNVPAFVREALGYEEAIDESWRGDTARYAYLLQELTLHPHQTVADIGANTGFFVLSLAHRYPDCQFVAYETHPNHVDFIRLVVDAFELGNVTVQAQSVDLAGLDDLPVFDVILHLNVLHHAGHDFDADLVNGPQEIAVYAKSYLSKLAKKASLLAFQLGYNWGGDKTQPIIATQNQTAMVSWLSGLFDRTGWQVAAMAFATRNELGDIVFKNLPAELAGAPHLAQTDNPGLTRAIDSYHLEQFKGEFYRRPMVIGRSKGLAAQNLPENGGAPA